MRKFLMMIISIFLCFVLVQCEEETKKPENQPQPAKVEKGAKVEDPATAAKRKKYNAKIKRYTRKLKKTKSAKRKRKYKRWIRKYQRKLKALDKK